MRIGDDPIAHGGLDEALLRAEPRRFVIDAPPPGHREQTRQAWRSIRTPRRFNQIDR